MPDIDTSPHIWLEPRSQPKQGESAADHALRWLKERGGTGVFDKKGALLAAGERAPVMRSTWNKLRDAKKIIIEGKRVRVSQ